jgi:hypothetical protein
MSKKELDVLNVERSERRQHGRLPPAIAAAFKGRERNRKTVLAIAFQTF